MAALRRLWFLTPIAPALLASRAHVRLIHSTPVAAKKKAGRGASSSQMFSEAVEDEYQDEAAPEAELFGGATSSAKSPSGSGALPEHTLRAAKFDTIIMTAMKRFTAEGKRMKGNPPRRTVVHQLCRIADTKEQLEKILDIVAVFRSASVPVDTTDFFGRCMTLDAPEFVLRALQNRPKYGLDVPSLASARAVLNALALQKTDAVVADCLAFAELYPLYGLPPVAQEPVSSVILAGIIARRGADNTSDDAKADVAVVHEYLSEIFGKAEGAAGAWNPAATTSANETRWLRRSMVNIMAAERKAGDVQPWVLQLDRQLRSGLLRTS